MNYKYFNNMNFEDFSSGRIIYNEAGFTNYNARLACEIFMRCFEFLGKPNERVSLYDPCCGSGYLLTVIGFLCGKHIHSIYGSDISDAAVSLTEKNLSLLTAEGLCERKEQIKVIHELYGKHSHLQALEGTGNLLKLVGNNIECKSFRFDALAECSGLLSSVDIIITDVPYGNMVSWSESEQLAINKMLDNFAACLSENSVVAISSDKNQKINNLHYKRLDKFLVGKRKIEILKKNIV